MTTTVISLWDISAKDVSTACLSFYLPTNEPTKQSASQSDNQLLSASTIKSVSESVNHFVSVLFIESVTHSVLQS